MSNSPSINNITFTPGRAITDPVEVNENLIFFQERVKKLGDDYFILYPSEEERDARNRSYKISIGPIEIDVAFDSANLGVVITVYLKIPFIGTVQVGQVSGNLKDGVEVSVGYSGILSGTVGIKLQGNDVVLYWDLEAFGYHYKDQVVIFSI